MKKRLFIISNRLPVTVDEEKGIRQASGGLVTAINSYLENDNTSSYDEVFWAGVPGCNVVTWRNSVGKLEATSFNYLPVFVTESEYDGYYNGHSNSLLWPLFHYFPSYAEYNAEHYSCYQKVNEQFAETLSLHLRPTDTVWIHDYHLLPLAALLRKAIPELTIGLFLHIPFPSFEIFRLLPKKWQEEMLTGMLGADLIGFHTIDYASHFLQSVLRVLGLDNDRHLISHDNRLIKIDVFPISIDYAKFQNAYNDTEVASIRDSMRHRMRDRKIIFSVDRLDYTKGVHNRLKAYDLFLQQNPQYHGKVVFILVIVPSRDTIPRYAERKKMIDEMISRINSKTGNIHWVPVIYQYNSLDFNEMIALYTACDLALITPLRDGMNLVSKEFIASRRDKKGVLIISEMAGAARELTDALTINPNDVLDIAQKIKQGLEMKEEEQATHLEAMQKRIANYDVRAWAEDFMTEIENIKHKQQSFRIKFLDYYTKRSLYDAYRNSKKRLLLLDYDGTLVPFSSIPEQAAPGRDLLMLLKNLAEAEENEVYLISGRSSSWLEKHFGELPLNLIAEHGARYKAKRGQWITEAQTHNEWKEQVHKTMQMYERRCANSSTEEKEFSMVWHYRNCNVE
ncbi:MAG TPA: bifunctional alpha,alpha-trehalose-phosphate synthase (UDP-forming)/trehalose-phosphatase, partial [Flavisolibacter sp.]|nr:bifunctional alpha,alpha-trehalose-phosphate synthase (UDP-forming)/trehalose-phosphatase [Flavisolibacter sp.]